MKEQTNRDYDFHIRMTEEEREELDRVAENCGMTRSELVRLLAKLPTREIDNGNLHLVAVDTGTVTRIHREMRKFGTNFNQAVHALNSINFYLKHDSLKYEYLAFAVPEIKEQLDRVEEQQTELHRDMRALETSMPVGRQPCRFGSR